MNHLENGTKIEVFNVEGETLKKGLKQNKIYTILSNSGIVIHNGIESDLRCFHIATDGKQKFSIWVLDESCTQIGIAKCSHRRYSYTKNFKIINS
jgi:hypothetical protein